MLAKRLDASQDKHQAPTLSRIMSPPLLHANADHQARWICPMSHQTAAFWELVALCFSNSFFLTSWHPQMWISLKVNFKFKSFVTKTLLNTLYVPNAMRVLGKQLNKPTPQHQRTHSGNKEENKHVLSSIISSVADVCSGHAGCVSKELTGN